MSSAAYIRVSTSDQADALAQQRARLIAYGIAPENIYEDILSGSKATRKEYLRLLQDVEKGLVTSVVCTRVDRLGRSTAELLRAVELFNKVGCTFECLDQSGLDVSSSSGKMMTAVLSVLAEFERSMMLERVRAGVDHRRLNLSLVTECPFGYKLIGGKIVLDNEAFLCLLDDKTLKSKYDLARELIDLYLSGLSKRDLLLKLEKKYYRIFSVSGLRKYFRNRCLLGELKIGDKVFYKNHPSIVSLEEFKQLEFLKIKRDFSSNNISSDYNNRFLLAGLVKCSVCNTNYTCSSTKNKYGDKYFYIRHRDVKCAATNKLKLKESDLYLLVENYICDFITDSGPDGHSYDAGSSDSLDKLDKLDSNPRLIALHSQLEGLMLMNKSAVIKAAIESTILEIRELEEILSAKEVTPDIYDLLEGLDDLDLSFKPERDNESNKIFCSYVKLISISFEGKIAIDLLY